MHALLLSLIALGIRTLSETSSDFLILLDESAAHAPVGSAAIAHSASLDAESFTDLASLHHGEAVNRSISQG